jgi:hypothetical protein
VVDSWASLEQDRKAFIGLVTSAGIEEKGLKGLKGKLYELLEGSEAWKMVVTGIVTHAMDVLMIYRHQTLIALGLDAAIQQPSPGPSRSNPPLTISTPLPGESSHQLTTPQPPSTENSRQFSPDFLELKTALNLQGVELFRNTPPPLPSTITTELEKDGFEIQNPFPQNFVEVFSTAAALDLKNNPHSSPSPTPQPAILKTIQPLVPSDKEQNMGFTGGSEDVQAEDEVEEEDLDDDGIGEEAVERDMGSKVDKGQEFDGLIGFEDGERLDVNMELEKDGAGDEDEVMGSESGNEEGGNTGENEEEGDDNEERGNTGENEEEGDDMEISESEMDKDKAAGNISEHVVQEKGGKNREEIPLAVISEPRIHPTSLDKNDGMVAR